LSLLTFRNLFLAVDLSVTIISSDSYSFCLTFYLFASKLYFVEKDLFISRYSFIYSVFFYILLAIGIFGGFLGFLN
jgi:hypothetical protein